VCVHWEIGKDAITVKPSPRKMKKGLEDVKYALIGALSFQTINKKLTKNPAVCVMCDSKKE